MENNPVYIAVKSFVPAAASWGVTILSVVPSGVADMMHRYAPDIEFAMKVGTFLFSTTVSALALMYYRLAIKKIKKGG